MEIKNFVLIAAGGIGSRMGKQLPKQFLLLDGKPVLMHTLSQFNKAKTPAELIVILSDEMKEYWKSLCVTHNFSIPHKVVSSGNSRFQSIKNGLDFIAKTYPWDSIGLISVHDGARPIIEPQLIDQSFHACKEYGTAVCATQSTNSIRIGNHNASNAVDRDEVWIIQTPQVFRSEILFKAYSQEEDPLFTDDSSVVEKMGNTIYLIEGDNKNIKITYKEDLAIAQLYLNNLT
ncbi:2-C-methyl-D-erythritol 4-phosphate cytidylyltransferase [Sphingobacterium hungaricum]